MATMMSEAYHAAQPALLYLVPLTLAPLYITAYSNVRQFLDFVYHIHIDIGVYVSV